MYPRSASSARMRQLSPRSAECPLLAQSRHSTTEFRCPLSGVKRTLSRPPGISAYDPLRTLRLRFSKPLVQNGLVLHRIKLGDLAKSHYLRFAIGLVRQELFQFFQRLRTRYQNSSLWRNTGTR